MTGVIPRGVFGPFHLYRDRLAVDLDDKVYLGAILGA